jgi:hypothetical protein
MFRSSQVHRSLFYKLYVQIWYVVIHVLLDASSRYGVVGELRSSYNTITAGHCVSSSTRITE